MNARKGIELPILAIVVGLSMIVGAAFVMVWEQEQIVTITPRVTVEGFEPVLNVIAGSETNFSMMVKNPGGSNVNVSLVVVSNNTGVTVLYEEGLKLVPAGGIYVYVITVKASPDATGSAALTYTLSQV